MRDSLIKVEATFTDTLHMGLFSKLVGWGITSSATVGLGVVAANHLLPPELRPDKLGAYIAVMRLKQTNPFAKPEDVKKVFANTPDGMNAVVNQLQEQMKTETKAPPLDPNALGIFSDEDIINKKSETTAQPNGMPSESEIVVSNSQPSAGFDPSAEDRIRAMMIPDDMKKRILDNYNRTGVLPDVFQNAARQPANDSNSK